MSDGYDLRPDGSVKADRTRWDNEAPQCPVPTLTEQSYDFAEPYRTAYKLSNKRFSYIDIDLCLHQHGTSKVLRIAETEHVSAESDAVTGAQQEFMRTLNIRLENEARLRMEVYLVHAEPARVPIEVFLQDEHLGYHAHSLFQLSDLPPCHTGGESLETDQTVCMWRGVSRVNCSRCYAGNHKHNCVGPTLKGIQRLGKAGRNYQVSRSEAEECKKHPGHIFLSMDEGCSHVGGASTFFRLIYTAYDLETNKMIGLLVSHRYKCVINNDTPDSAPHETLSMTMDNDWSGWDIATGTRPPRPLRPDRIICTRPRASAYGSDRRLRSGSKPQEASVGIRELQTDDNVIVKMQPDGRRPGKSGKRQASSSLRDVSQSGQRGRTQAQAAVNDDVDYHPPAAGLELDQQEHFARPIRRSRRCNSFSDHLYDSADVHEAEENPCGLIVQQCEPEAEEATMYDALATSYFPQSAEVVERLIATELQRVAFPPRLPLDWQAQMNDTAQLDRLQPGYLCHELMRQQSMPFEYSPQLSSCSRLPSSHAHEPAGPCTPALASAAQLVRPRPLPGQLSAMALDAGMPDDFLPAPEALSPPPALLMTRSGARTFIAPTHGFHSGLPSTELEDSMHAMLASLLPEQANHQAAGRTSSQSSASVAELEEAPRQADIVEDAQFLDDQRAIDKFLREMTRSRADVDDAYGACMLESLELPAEEAGPGSLQSPAA